MRRQAPWRSWGTGAWVLALLLVPVLLSGTEVPFLTARVNDTVGALSLETLRDLESVLKAHEDSTSNQIAVLIIESLEGESIEEYSIRVVDAWKLGQHDKDNGVLLLVSRGDRKVRIEVGRGLEEDLPDITCGSIIRKEIVPRLKSGDYDGGVRAGVVSIIDAIRGSYTPDESDDRGVATGNWLLMVFPLAIFLVVVGIFTLVGLFSSGFQSWFLYIFLVPFWFAFPTAFFGLVPGLVLLGIYALAFPIMKIWFRLPAGKAFQERWAKKTKFGTAGGGGWSSGGSSSSGSSSSSGGFSGGGGGFSGGGASGSW
jgi:uncharacterized protein